AMTGSSASAASSAAARTAPALLIVRLEYDFGGDIGRVAVLRHDNANRLRQPHAQAARLFGVELQGIFPGPHVGEQNGAVELRVRLDRRLAADKPDAHRGQADPL